MVNLATLLQKFTQDTLNANTKGIKFIVDTYVATNNDGDFVIKKREGYKILTKDYTPAIINTFGDSSYISLPNVEIINVDYPIELYVRYSDNSKGYQNVLDSIEEFRIAVVGKLIDLDKDNNIKGQFTLTPVSAPSINEVSTGETYVILSFRVKGQVGKDLYWGGDVQYFIKNENDQDYVEIYPIARSQSRTKEMTSAHIIGDNSITSIASTNAWASGFSMFIQPNIPLSIELRDMVEDDNIPMNKVFDYKVKYPDKEFARKVLFSGGTITPINLTPITIELDLQKANNIITNGTILKADTNKK